MQSEIGEQGRWTVALRSRHRSQSRPPCPLWKRTLHWATAAICLALVLGSASEYWVRLGIERQTQAIQQRNAVIQHDITATTEALKAAQSPDTIEREARAWGYTRPGEQPVFVLAPRRPSK